MIHLFLLTWKLTCSCWPSRRTASFTRETSPIPRLKSHVNGDIMWRWKRWSDLFLLHVTLKFWELWLLWLLAYDHQTFYRIIYNQLTHGKLSLQFRSNWDHWCYKTNGHQNVYESYSFDIFILISTHSPIYH